MKMLPDPDDIDKRQPEDIWSARSTLIDWLFEINDILLLELPTWFLCVNYIDRFLSCKSVSISRLRLVGIAALFIATKFDRIGRLLTTELLMEVCDSSYTVEAILKAKHSLRRT